MNTSKVNDDKTARTCPECAEQRSNYLKYKDIKNVLELCVGPSLQTLESFYKNNSILVTGNDIEKRWKNYYPKGKWIIGDAFSFDYNKFDAVIFAPPLSNGCTGKREDSLSINEVFPAYNTFWDKIIEDDYKGLVVMVLPGRSQATRGDRTQFYKLLNYLERPAEVMALRAGKKGIIKYYDLIIDLREKA